MNAEHIASLYDYVNEGRGDDDRIAEIDCCDIGGTEASGDGWSGWIVRAAGVDAMGCYDALRDLELFVPDDRCANMAEKSNDGWHLLNYASELTLDDLAGMADAERHDDEAARMYEAERIAREIGRGDLCGDVI